MKLIFGTRAKKLIFADECEYYTALGVLCSGKYTEIVFEHNDIQGAWGKEGRILFNSDIPNMPSALKNNYTRGVGSIRYRVNCSDYVQTLIQTHNFASNRIPGKTTVMVVSPDVNQVKKTVDPEYLQCFNAGLEL